MPSEYLLPKNVVPVHYEVTLHPNPNPPFKFNGEVKATIDVKEATSTIVLNSHKIKIASAEFCNGDNKQSSTSIEYNKLFDQTATITFENPLPTGEATLCLSFEAEHGDDMAGFYRSEAKAVDGASYYMLVTQFEPTDCRRCIPCWDEPAHKATFECSLVFPSDFTQTALSNTPAVSDSVVDGKRVVKFAKTPRMSSYLLAFVVGHFTYTETSCVPCAEDAKEDEKHTVTVRVYTAPGNESRGKFAAKTAAQVLEYLAGFYNVGYPLPKLDMVAIPDFAAGAMENWGLVTYRETALLCDPPTASLASLQRVAYVVAHELAHQWFGNLVTMQWWDELWLNEGYATYVGTQAVDHVHPEWNMWTLFVTDYVLRAMALDAKMSTHPVQVTVHTPAEINEIFDAISYCKGASLIRLLVAHIGVDAFRNGIRAYLAQHKYSNASTKDLFTAMSKTSGVNVDGLLERFISDPGFPLVSAKLNSEGKVVVELTQKRYLASGEPADGVWPLKLRARTSNGIVEVEMPATNSPYVSEELSKTVADGGWFLLNADGASYHRSEYDDALLQKLTPNLSALSGPERMFLFSDVWANDISQGLRLTEGMKNETDSAVWAEIGRTIGEFRLLAEARGDDALVQAARKWMWSIFQPKLDELGMEPKAGEDTHAVDIRCTLLGAMVGAKNEAVTKHLLAKFSEDRAELDKIDANLRGLVYCVAARDHGNHAALRRLYEATDDATERTRLLSACSIAPIEARQDKDKSIVYEILDWAIPDAPPAAKPVVKPQDAFNVICMSSGSSYHAQVISWEWLQKRWERVVKMYGSGQFLLAAIVGRSFSRFASTDVAASMESFFSENPVESAKRSAAQSVEGVKARAARWEKSEKDIKAFLEEKK